MKVLIIGLDGTTWEVLDDLLLDRYMPNLKRLKNRGCSGILESTEPPITPPAWTTCITGCLPQTHGIAGFREYSFKDNSIGIGNASSCLVPNMWEELSVQGFSVASINVPWTYPCRKIQGITITGHGSPNVFTFPEEFKKKLIDEIPDYDIVANCKMPENGTFSQFQKKIALVERSFEQRFEAAKLVSKEINCDIMMVQFQDLDKLGHFMWPYMDKNLRDNYPSHRDRLFQMFAKLDSVIGKLLELANSKDLFVAVVSDHGMGPRKVDVKPNWLLHKWGYLKFRNPLQRSIRRSRRNLQSLFKYKKTRVSVEHKMPINWPRSKAVMLYTEINGFVYLNVKGRQPNGCVEPGKEYDDIIADLCKRFSEVSSPLNGLPVFARVARPTELYGVDQIDNERFGDLILVPQPYHFLKSKASKEGTYANLLRRDFLKGTHMPEGMYILSGPNIKTTVNKQTQIVNIAPTIYAVLGAKLPTYMDGKVFTDAFLQKITAQYQDGDSQCTKGISEKQQLSDDEETLIAKHLADLGYLD